MANTSIGKGSLVLSTQDNITPGLNQLSGVIKSWAQKTSAGLKGMLGMDKGGSWLGSLKGGITGLVAGFGAGAFEGAIKGIKDLAAEGRKWKALGIESSMGMGVQAAAERVGISGEELTRAIANMGKNLNGMEKQGEKASTVFGDLGLNASKLRGMSLDKQFLSVADAISKLPPGYQRVAKAEEVFGRNAHALLPIINQGSAGIQEFIDKAKKIGTALDQKDMDKIMRAQQALPRLAAVFTGLKNKILVAIAPIVELIGNKLTKVVEFLIPIIDKVARAYSTHFAIIADICSEVFDAIQGLVVEIKDWIVDLFDLKSVSITVEEAVTKVWLAIAIGAAYCWDVIKVGAGVVAIGAGYIVKGFGAVIDVFHDLVNLAKQLPDSIKPSWVDDFADGVGQFADATKRSGDQMAKWGKGTIDNFGKSADDVRKWFKNRGKEMGEEAAKPFAKAFEHEMDKAKSGIERGSKEDYDIMVKRDVSYSNKQDAARLREFMNHPLVQEVRKNIAGILQELEASEIVKPLP